MPDTEDGGSDDLTPDQRRVLRAFIDWFRHEMANLGFGTLGPGREDTLKNNWWLNEARKRFESAENQEDAKWTRETRVWWLTEDQQAIRRQLIEEHERRKRWTQWRGSILTAVIGAIITAGMLLLFTKAPAIMRVFFP